MMTAFSTPPRWRLMLVPPRSGAENMARDTALMDRARVTGESVFSVYSWLRPTLSLGRNQTARGRYDLDAMKQRGIDLVRRPTGGRALLHHREVTYSVTAPIAEGDSLRDSYARINRILLEGLALLGVMATESHSEARAPSPGDLPCFAAPAEGELISGGAKLVGSAQYREAGALLQHGSILIEDDQSLVTRFLLSSSEGLQPPGAATLSDTLGRVPSAEEVAEALFDALRAREDRFAATMDESEIAAPAAALLGRYTSEWWTWRR